MSGPYQQVPLFPDVCLPYSYLARTNTAGTNNVTISAAGGSACGSVSVKPQCYFIAWGIRVFTNYDNVGPVIATANSVAKLSAPFTPNNFTLRVERGNSNKYSNNPMQQAEICSSSYRSGKVFPYPVVYGPRTNFQFTFVDTTNLFLLTATSGGTAVPLVIKLFLDGAHVPISQWGRFCQIYPTFAAIYANLSPVDAAS